MDGPFRELVFIANGNARLGQEGAKAARRALEDAGFFVRSFQVTRDEQELRQALERALAMHEPLIAIGGGDGTQRSAAELVAGTGSVMAVVPLGTGNAWATDLGVPVEPNAMAQVLKTACVKEIDLGIANGRGFVNVATIGLTSLIAKNLEKGNKSALGRLAYLPAVLRSLKELRPFKIRVETEQGVFEGEALQFVAAVGTTHAGPFKVTQDAVNDDGLLSLYVLNKTGKFGLLRFFFALVRGHHTDLEEVWTCEAREGQVTTIPPRRIIVDGELDVRDSLTLLVRNKALRVLSNCEKEGQ